MPTASEIEWVEFELVRARYGAWWEKSAVAERPKDLEVWLSHTRDKKSWKEIGEQFFRKSKPEARRSEARRCYERVQRYLDDPGAPEFYEYRLKQLIAEKFGVSAEVFQFFILHGHLPRKVKRIRVPLRWYR